MEGNVNGKCVGIEDCSQRTMFPRELMVAGILAVVVMVRGSRHCPGGQPGGAEDNRPALVQRRGHVARRNDDAAGEREVGQTQ